MKKILQIICCAVGSGMIGFFASELNTIVGAVCFTLGVALLVGSIVLISKRTIQTTDKFKFDESIIQTKHGRPSSVYRVLFYCFIRRDPSCIPCRGRR